MLCALLPLLLPVLVTGQVEVDGPCPEPPLMKNFEPHRYGGKWYMAQMYAPSQPLSCPTSTYEIKSGSPDIEFTNTETTGPPKFYQSTYGKLAPEPGNAGSYLIKMVGQCSGHWALDTTVKHEAKYKILATDYKTHSLVWDCYNTDTTPVRSVQFLRVLTKEQHGCVAKSADGDTCWKTIETKLKSLNLSTAHLQKNDLIFTYGDGRGIRGCSIVLGGIIGSRKRKSANAKQVEEFEDFCKAYLKNTTSRKRRELFNVSDILD